MDNYPLLRLRAQSSCESHIASLLFSAAKQIVQTSKKYTRRSRIVNERQYLSDAQTITSRLTDSIERYISDYALAAARHLKIDSENVESFLVSDTFGKTSRERTEAYLRNFAEDIFRMTKAGILLGYNEQQILSSVRTGYKSPYVTSVITKARKKDINIATPSYGKGINHAAYRNIVRNARGMVALAWGRAQVQYGKETGAIGFTVFRGSSYPCDTCDYETTYFHNMTDPAPPFHTNCCCGIEFIYKKEDIPHKLQ